MKGEAASGKARCQSVNKQCYPPTAKAGLWWGWHPWGHSGHKAPPELSIKMHRQAQLRLSVHPMAWDSAERQVDSRGEGGTPGTSSGLLVGEGTAPRFKSGKG